MSEENKINSLMLPEVFNIANHEINMQALEVKLAQDTKHTINGVSDTVGYKEAVKYRAVYRTFRTELEKQRKSLSKPAQDFLKELKNTTDTLGAKAFTGEQYFDELITAVDNEKARIKKEKEEAAQRLLLARINDLTSNGAQLVDGNYILPYSEDIEVPLASIPDVDEQGWLIVMDSVIVAYQQEQERLENERIAKEKAEQEALAEKQRLEEENRRLEEELAELRSQKVWADLQAEEMLKEHDQAMTDIILHGQYYAVEKFTPSEPEPSDFNGREVGAGVFNSLSEYQEACLVTLTFSKEKPFIEIPIGKKNAVRLYHSAYAVQAEVNSNVAIDKGSSQRLNWVYLKK